MLTALTETDSHTSGKHYFEFEATSSNVQADVSAGGSYFVFDFAANKAITDMTAPSPSRANGSTFALNFLSNTVMGVAVDVDNKTLSIYRGCALVASVSQLKVGADGLGAYFWKRNNGAQSIMVTNGNTPFTCAVPAGYTAGW